MENDVSFGVWLAKRRKALDLTRQELAQKIGCSPSALRKIESDERRPSKQLAELLASTLDIPTETRAAFIKIARGEVPLERLKSPSPLPGLSLFQQPPQPFLIPIPTPLTPLIGRETELSALRQMLGDPQCRLITLVGPGGIGKTRLAIEVVLGKNKEYDNGAVFVSLASINSVSLIVPTIADAMGFKMQGLGDPRKQLLNYLHEKKSLLVLDNFEHLLEGVGLLVEIIQYAPAVKILCTSRERLNVQGEWVFDVRGLSDHEAVVLFANCVRRIESDFWVKDDNKLEIEQICHLVEGMPLAIELATTWVRLLSLSEIAQEIQRNLDFLSTNMRDVPEEHRSMRAVFDHSWGLLTKEEQQVLSRLSVFQGGFTLEAAKQVAGASLAILSSLASKSLVQRTKVGRYSLHELLRQYSASYLESNPTSSAATRRKHYDFYLTLAETADAQLRGPHQLEWLVRLEQEHDNMRGAIEWSLIGRESELHGKGGDLALKLAAALCLFWDMRGDYNEGCNFLMKALELSPLKLETNSLSSSLASIEDMGDPVNLKARACALEGLASMSNLLGNHSVAYALAEQSAAICRNFGDKLGLANALLIMGHALRWLGKVTLSHSQLEEALVLYREVGDQRGEARCLFRLGKYLTDFGGEISGYALLEESLAILEKLGDKFLLDNVLISLGIISLSAGNYTHALSQFDRGLAIAREIGDPYQMADALTNIGCVLRIQGDYGAASSYFKEALRIYQEVGQGIWCTDPLCALAENDIAQGNLVDAHLHLQDASGYAELSENRWVQTLIGYFQGLLAYYDGDMDGSTKWLEKVITLSQESQYKPDLARSLVTLGRVMNARGENAKAAMLLCEGLGLFQKMDSKLGIAVALEGFAELALPENAKNAMRFMKAAEAIRNSIGAPLPPIDCPSYESRIAIIRSKLGERALVEASARAQAGPWTEVVTELLTSSKN